MSIESTAYWLIERGQQDGQTPTLWLRDANAWNSGEPYLGVWTETAIEAIRFETSSGAKQYIYKHSLHLCRATEHLDLAPAEPTGAWEDERSDAALVAMARIACAAINTLADELGRDTGDGIKLASVPFIRDHVADLQSALATARQERDAALKREESTTMHRDVVDQHRCDLERIAQQQTGMITSLRARIAELEREGKAWRDQGTDDGAVYFYERDFYVLSNFSAFTLKLGRFTYPTSEHAYQAQKFIGVAHGVWESIAFAPSAHIAFKIAEQYARLRRPDWNDVKINVMRDILGAKANQHEYVRRKLIQSGTRTLIENSWRDDFWGWGADGQGQNMLGKLWMGLRSSLATPPADGDSK